MCTLGCVVESSNRQKITRWVKYGAWLIVAAVFYVLFDFAIDVRPAGIHSSYRFSVATLNPDEPVVLQQDNLSIVVIRRSASTIERLRTSVDDLLDPESRESRQPSMTNQRLRSHHEEYFVAFALGTHLGCPLQVAGDLLTETCSKASYDFAGRALKGNGDFRNLDVPEYSFSDQFRTLTIKP